MQNYQQNYSKSNPAKYSKDTPLLSSTYSRNARVVQHRKLNQGNKMKNKRKRSKKYELKKLRSSQSKKGKKSVDKIQHTLMIVVYV